MVVGVVAAAVDEPGEILGGIPVVVVVVVVLLVRGVYFVLYV